MNNIGEKLVCLGAFIILLSFGLLLYENHAESNALNESEKALLKLNDVILEEDTDDEKTIIVDDYEYMGVISIPKINIELPIISDWSYEKLEKSPCVYYGSIEENNLVILAHSYKYHFRYLNKLNAKDKVIITDAGGNNYVYEVIYKDILDPQKSDKVIETEYDLVLFSCYNSGTQRITVYCNKIK